MPKLLQDSDLPSQVRRRGFASQLRRELEELTEGQVLVYESGEPTHIHRPATDASRNNYACRIQEVAGLINRSHLSTRLVTAHDDSGSVYISCKARRPIHDNT
jgi:hypothetical protein